LQLLFASCSLLIYAAAMLSRREQNRATTVAQIKVAALDQVAAEGAPALSLRGVARSIGMSPAGLYRYYDGRDALLTDLLVDAYNDLADVVSHAAGLPTRSDGSLAGSPPAVADPMAALLAAITAYRSWGVDHPARFLLIFGTPVPGYSAPEDGPTVAANRRMGQVFFTLAAQAWREGLVADPAGQPGPPTPGQAELLAMLRQLAPTFPAALIPVMLGGWALWHGLVTLEITGQLDWVFPDAAGFYTERVTAWLDQFAAGRG
jgi:AcrR family transcriptional regulator